jgi:hypothetical protein
VPVQAYARFIDRALAAEAENFSVIHVRDRPEIVGSGIGPSDNAEAMSITSQRSAPGETDAVAIDVALTELPPCVRRVMPIAT